MSDQTGEDIGALAPPELFPLIAPAFLQYAQSGSVHFGWEAAAVGHADGRLTVSKWKWSGGSVVVANWPLTPEGWVEAWNYMHAEQPALATAVAAVASQHAEKRAEAVRRAENQAALNAEGVLDVLRGCVLLGGYGFEAGIRASESVDIYFTEAGMWVTRTGGFKPGSFMKQLRPR